MKMKAAFAFCCLACGSSIVVAVNQEFSLQQGQTAEVAGFTITFRGVANDSRCPIGVFCITAGNAEVQLLVDSVITLNTNHVPESATLGSYDLQLIELTPHPDRTGVHEPYRARLRLSTH